MKRREIRKKNNNLHEIQEQVECAHAHAYSQNAFRQNKLEEKKVFNYLVCVCVCLYGHIRYIGTIYYECVHCINTIRRAWQSTVTAIKFE